MTTVMDATSSVTAPTKFIKTKLETYACRRFGQGGAPPLVCLQHFTGTLDNWDPAVTDPIARGREVILFESAGVGRSTGEAPTTVQGMAAHFLAFADALDLQQVDLLGFSLGGMVAQSAALQRPSLIRKMLLVGTAPEGRRGPHAPGKAGAQTGARGSEHPGIAEARSSAAAMGGANGQHHGRREVVDPTLIQGGTVMTSKRMRTIAVATALGSALGGSAVSAQDKYAVKVPGGLAFSEFRGYEGWQVISLSQSGNIVAVILGNPAMVQAYQKGIPANGKPVPDGAKMAKIHWTAKRSETAPSPTTVPGALHDVDFMVKDSKRFADSGGWGYGAFKYDPASRTFTPASTADVPPQANDAKCGFGCHTIVKSRDYVFTDYGPR